MNIRAVCVISTKVELVESINDIGFYCTKTQKIKLARRLCYVLPVQSNESSFFGWSLNWQIQQSRYDDRPAEMAKVKFKRKICN